MNRGLGGWHRLFLFLSGLWFVLIVVGTWFTRPSPSGVMHQHVFYDRMPEEARGRILNTRVPTENEDAFVSDAKNARGAEAISASNGHLLIFEREKNKPWEKYAAIGAYENQLRIEASKEIATHILLAFVWWVVPLVGVYLLSFGVHWTYRGFKPK